MPKSTFKTLETISPSLQAKLFFKAYVLKRHPVVVKGLPDDANFRGTKWMDTKLEYLAEKAGDVTVMVEPINPSSNQFGTDIERIPMAFKDFLSSLQASQGPYHYLTTQYSLDDKDDSEGRDGMAREELTNLPPPTNALAGDFPLVPRLLGNLSLQQVNLWLGKSKEGSSSGLHHDFHDNLYILLSGCKRFVLYPPAEHLNLYPHGMLDKFHSNGLISYKDAPVRSDGLPVRTAARARVKAIQQRLETMMKDRQSSEGEGRDQERKKWTEMHNEALDDLAKVTLDAVDDEGFGFGEGEEDDFDALRAGLESEDEDQHAGTSSKVPAADEEEEEDGPTIGIDEEEEEDGVSSFSASNEPSSFSRIPTHVLHTHLELPTTALPSPAPSSASFPNLQNTGKPYVVHLNAGEMLYLPASWWHEVTSVSTAASVGTDVHMAFNYWFYPPTGQIFEEPYDDSLVWEYLKGQQSQSDGKRKRAQDEEGDRKKAKR